MIPKFDEFSSNHCCLKKFPIFTAPAGNPRLFAKWQRRSIRKTSPAFVISQRRLLRQRRACSKLSRSAASMSRVCALNASQSWENDKCCMAWLLSKQDDFVNQVSMLETFINEAGHECIFLPKFHCELNPIEMVSLIIT